jgi:hypothetical protein
MNLFEDVEEIKVEEFKKLSRVEQANHMLKSFCRQHEDLVMFTQKWETNISLIKMYAEEIDNLNRSE